MAATGAVPISDSLNEQSRREVPGTRKWRRPLLGPPHSRYNAKAVGMKESSMRWVYMAVIIVLVVAALIFAVQNFQSVTVSFLGLRITAPHAFLVAIIYLLGMITGGSLWALTRRAFERARS